ncbi:MAG TPA: hypothetical protein VNZ86_04795 [Bacteroidia bacterium]|jgi:hypothetical protein|nr:hypothetical protein [Bacteroidia bacterium]
MSNKPPKTILFTFDYELFLGKRSGSVTRCLLEPTEQILTILGQRKLKGIFFIDTTYLLRLQDLALQIPAAAEDYKRIRAQIKQMLQRGHYVFPHLHPHWIDAIYLPELNQWDLSNTQHYRFHALSDEWRTSVFTASINLLNEILSLARKPFQLNGFRAGGWSIQPFSDFKPFFEQHGIQYDFTVMNGWAHFSTAQYFDFRTEQKLPNIYTFSDDILSPSPGPFTEFGISRLKKPGMLNDLMNRVELKILPSRIRSSYGDGYSIVAPGIMDEALIHVEDPGAQWEMASLELLKNHNLKFYIEYLKTTNYIQLISHPKMLSPHNIHNAERFMDWAQQHYRIESDFKKLIPS